MDTFKIYESLKDKIVWLELKPESTVNLSELAKSYGVSRYPITMALYLLEAEGLVIRNGTHFMVSPLSLNRIKECNEIRLALEVKATVWAMNRITPAEVSILESLQEEMSQLKLPVNNIQYLKLDVKFHHTLFKAAKNILMEQMLERILNHYLRFWLSIPYDTTPNITDTKEIIHAIKVKDETLLREVCTEHVVDSLRGIMAIG